MLLVDKRLREFLNDGIAAIHSSFRHVLFYLSSIGRKQAPSRKAKVPSDSLMIIVAGAIFTWKVSVM